MELDLRLGTGLFFFRLDLDVRMTSADPDGTALGPPDWSIVANGVKVGPPEWAMLQIGREDYHLRLGIITHAVGFEDWDVWNNYFPTFSSTYWTNFGRMAGAEPGLVLGDGYEINAWGGFDFDYDAPTFGAGFTTFQGTWGTWSGIGIYPTINYYAGLIATELYPADELSIVVEGSAGASGLEDEVTGDVTLSPFVGGDIVLNVLPAAVVHPVFRFEGLYDPDGALGLPTISGSAGLIAEPFEGLKIGLEGKASRIGDSIFPGMFLGISVRRPEPLPYAVVYEEEEAPPAEARRGGARQARSSAPQRRNIAAR